ncbi:hypothetical protein CASFOL_031781 [Castilleja foliolosa]|uniref:Uncharacterized protein n=1 Tax=Castilleja foliolosa TaxID=1961234 RepID=A0ABD3BZM3_9LAMI
MIKNTTYIKPSKSSNLALGAMVTELAWSKGWRPGNMKKVRPRMLPTGKRLLRTPLRPKGKLVEITILRNRDDDEDADFVPKIPPEPRTNRATKTKSAPPIGAQADPPQVPIGASTDPTSATIGPQTDSPAAPIGPLTDPPPHPIEESADPHGEAPTDPTAAPERPGFPFPLEFEVPPVLRARAKKDRTRPGQQVPPSPPRVARVSFDGPTKKEFEEMRSEMRANHRATMERQVRIEAKMDRFFEESRVWRASDRELKDLLLDRNGFVDDLNFDEEAMARAHAERAARDHIPMEP